jgi:dihydroorotate dehydrogenase
VPIVGAGGVMSAEDAYAKIRAGASLVQVYTGLIYGGPALVKRLNEGLSRLLARDGFSRVEEAVGADLREGGQAAERSPPGVARTR